MFLTAKLIKLSEMAKGYLTLSYLGEKGFFNKFFDIFSINLAVNREKIANFAQLY